MLAPDWIEKNPLYYSAQLVNSKFISHSGAHINRVAWNWHSNTLFPGAPLFLSIFLNFSSDTIKMFFNLLYKHPLYWNYFRDYSSSGLDASRGSMPYQYIYSTKFGSYAFNGIDLNPNPGPRRPFNFFGHVDQVKNRMF